MSHELDQEEPTWERFSNWIHCICVVTFDLELGQALEVSFINVFYYYVHLKSFTECVSSPCKTYTTGNFKYLLFGIP